HSHLPQRHGGYSWPSRSLESLLVASPRPGEFPDRLSCQTSTGTGGCDKQRLAPFQSTLYMGPLIPVFRDDT
ncbi:hypothetical protein PIB30_093152, partial [Stylosanthes scabra]|nr:hypothetical protein [Stylosanthes scabra]